MVVVVMAAACHGTGSVPLTKKSACVGVVASGGSLPRNQPSGNGGEKVAKSTRSTNPPCTNQPLLATRKRAGETGGAFSRDVDLTFFGVYIKHRPACLGELFLASFIRIFKQTPVVHFV